MSPANRLDEGRLLTLEEVRRVAPDLDFRGVVGGASWNDAQMHSSERVTFEFVASAAAHGACVANHVHVEELLSREGTGARSARARPVRRLRPSRSVRA